MIWKFAHLGIRKKYYLIHTIAQMSLNLLGGKNMNNLMAIC